eukprot:2870174-Pyramimonas_sp.AAC.1
MESEGSVGEKSGLFEDTESDVIAYYKKPPSEIDMKPTSIGPERRPQERLRAGGPWPAAHRREHLPPQGAQPLHAGDAY